jgi:CO/xanthine dehydrogenase Mo-binding subunit
MATIPPLLEMASPLRGSHLRLPSGPSTSFASECFIDELASATGTDPVQFRIRYLTEDRQIAALKTAAEAAGWESRPSPKPGAGRNESGVVTGRGIALREQIATFAEVEVNLESGKIRVKRFVCAHECGLIVNPNGLRNVVEGNLLHSMSRALYEEVKFDRSNVTSVDWRTYPIATIDDVPDKIDVVLINRPDLPPLGAGEQASGQTAAAIANAVFDATGVRLRRVPFTAKRVKMALDARA